MIEFAAETHRGNRYQHNEDALGWREERGVWVVADGMGGHARGDIAANIVKDTVLTTAKDPTRSLAEMISLAHEAVLLEGIDQSLHNMGSTVVMVRVQEATAEIAWCGDSRAYLWRQGELVRLTRDHSLLEQLLESGIVQPEEAFGHPQQHVLVQALGIDNPRPHASELTLQLANGDLLLLCSDGLHDELREETIAATLSQTGTPLGVVAALLQQVLKGTGRDNVSIICLAVSGLAEGDGELPVVLRERLRASQGVFGRVVQAKATTETSVAVVPATLAGPRGKLTLLTSQLSTRLSTTAAEYPWLPWAAAATGLLLLAGLLGWLST